MQEKEFIYLIITVSFFGIGLLLFMYFVILNYFCMIENQVREIEVFENSDCVPANGLEESGHHRKIFGVFC
jgi:hypothetical protein